jgi:hypothetical protein
MNRTPAMVRLDFVADVHEARIAGALLCLAGLAAAIATCVSLSRTVEERDRLEAAKELVPRREKKPASPESAKASADAVSILRELAVPWSGLLAELEAAARDSASNVSLLQVEPDPAKHQVRVTAEARTLTEALGFLRRMQKGTVLRYPMLESHERRKDDAEHPIRFRLVAEWQP